MYSGVSQSGPYINKLRMLLPIKNENDEKQTNLGNLC